MENEEIMNIDKFLSLFVSVSYLQRQYFLNIENFKNYCQLVFGLDENMTNLIEKKLNQMVDADLLSRIDGYDNLVLINKIPFKEITYEDDFEYIGDIKEFFYGFNNYVSSFQKEKDNDYKTMIK